MKRRMFRKNEAGHTDMGAVMIALLAGMFITWLFIGSSAFDTHEAEDYTHGDVIHQIEEWKEDIEDLSQQNVDLRDRVNTLEKTHWYTKYSVVNDELERERNSRWVYPVVTILVLIIALCILWYIHRKTVKLDILKKEKEIEKTYEDKLDAQRSLMHGQEEEIKKLRSTVWKLQRKKK